MDDKPVRRGPKSLYGAEHVDIICERISKGESLIKVCETLGLPSRHLFASWLVCPEKSPCPSEILNKYARARELQAEYYAEEIISISDDGSNDKYVDEKGKTRTDQDVIARSRLRVDARKWYASKLAPKKYGEKVETTVQGPDGGPVQYTRIEHVIVDKK